MACFQINTTISVSLNLQYYLHYEVYLLAEIVSIILVTLSSFWEITKKLFGLNSIDKMSNAIYSI